MHPRESPKLSETHSPEATDRPEARSKPCDHPQSAPGADRTDSRCAPKTDSPQAPTSERFPPVRPADLRDGKHPPKEAADANITGNVFVSFLINEQGFLEDLKVDERLHP
ncbi:MAG: hypothetical protein EOP09_11425, partial [Proteobacteria bacterium]